MHGTAGFGENTVEPDDDGRVVLGQLRGCFEKQPALLVTDCKSLYDASRQEGAAPSSADKRLAIEVAIVKSRATEGEADLRWIDARYQTADASRSMKRYCSETSVRRIDAGDTTGRERERERPRRFRQEASEGSSSAAWI